MLDIAHHFGSLDGASPTSKLVRIDGHLYGLTTISPTLFRTDLQGTTFTVLHAFEVTETPQLDLVVEGQFLYGITQTRLFRYNTESAAFETMYTFTPYNKSPTCLTTGLIGVTSEGGDHKKGTLFRFREGSDLETLMSFSAETGVSPTGITMTHIGLLGVTSEGGGIFRYDLSTGECRVLHAFTRANPTPDLMYHDGAIIGTTTKGGEFNKGTIFQIIDGACITLHSFGFAEDGYYPQRGPIMYDGALYGTTLFGGSHRAGVIYRLEMITREYNIIHDCGASGNEMAIPYGPLTAVNVEKPYLIGTTKRGGAGARGVIYRMVPFIPRPSCFNQGTLILTRNTWTPIETLRVGDMVMTYRHGLRPIKYIRKGIMINNPDVWYTCMYKGCREGFDPLVVKGGLCLLINKLSPKERVRHDTMMGAEDHDIDGMSLLVAPASNEFVKIQGRAMYKYYYFVIEGEDDNRRYGVYANGFLTETPSANMVSSGIYKNLIAA